MLRKSKALFILFIIRKVCSYKTNNFEASFKVDSFCVFQFSAVMRSPFVKFLNHTCAYMVFLLLEFMATVCFCKNIDRTLISDL